MTLLLSVTVVSMVIAIVMSLVAWRVASEERERSDARVAALSADIHAVAPAVAQAAGRRSEPAALRAVASAPMAQSAALFAAPPATASAQPAIVIGVGLLIFAAAAAFIVAVGGSTARPAAVRSAATPADAETAPARSPASTTAPLELVALGHDRDGDRLTVRGVIRNPAGGAPVQGLTAVVFVFDRDGGFLGSGRGSIDVPSLAAGGDSPFLVNVPGATNVARYRVSFRTETGIVAHVDKRIRP